MSLRDHKQREEAPEGKAQGHSLVDGSVRSKRKVHTHDDNTPAASQHTFPKLGQLPLPSPTRNGVFVVELIFTNKSYGRTVQ